MLRKRRNTNRRMISEVLRSFEQLERREVLASGADPLVLIPGFGGTFSADESTTGVNAWLTTRGIAPSQLALEPSEVSIRTLFNR